MSNEMKLLLAMCKAMGLKVEAEYDREERKIRKEEAMRINSHIDYPELRGLSLKSREGGMGQAMLDVDDEGMYTAFLDTPVVSYKVTKIVD